MKLFELARDINMHSNDLLALTKKWGLEATGIFQILSDKTVKDIREQLKKSPQLVTKITSKTTIKTTAETTAKAVQPTPDEEIANTEQPKVRRRLVSISSTGEVHRVETQKEEIIPTTEPPEQPEEQIKNDAASPQTETSPAQTNQTDKSTAQTETTPEDKKITPDDEKPARRREKRSDHKRPEITESPEWRDVRGNARDLDFLQHEGWVRPRRPRHTIKHKRIATSEEKHTFKPRQKAIKLSDTITVSKLASLIGIKGAQIIKKLLELEITATMNDFIDGSTAELVASEYGVQVEVDTSSMEDILKMEDIPTEQLEYRPPIITIMGHVDHGKTTLLDKIRTSQIASKEAGGITQHIGAYWVKSKFGPMVFLDTPGHEAFTSLRQRGARVTDIVALLVAADDGIMPQTIEAIQHAQAAEVPIVVVVNKIDRPNADIDKVKQQLLQHKLVVEELGGETMLVAISAKTGKGIEDLLESIHVQAELLELKSTSKGACSGVVIESNLDSTKGVVGSVLVQRGCLSIGDYFVAGSCSGRVRSMYNDQGKKISRAIPSTPVKLIGYNSMPEAGDMFQTLDSEQDASRLATWRTQRKRAASLRPSNRISLETFMETPVAENQARTLNIVLKADAQGSLESIIGTLEKEGNENVSVQIVRSGVGGITQADISLANVSNAVVIGFSVRADFRAASAARADEIDIKTYNIIYELTNDIHLALEGLLKPIVKEQIVGRCLVREVFAKSKDSIIAGGNVEDGKLERNAKLRLYRDDVLLGEASLLSLRRNKEDVSSIKQGVECGFRLKGLNDVKPGDMLEAYIQTEEKATLKRGGRILKTEEPEPVAETPEEARV